MSERLGYKDREITDEDVEIAKRTGNYPFTCCGILSYQKYQTGICWEINYFQLDLSLIHI